jgi:predicted AlkP superfamily phosphohydrolase/phosphomutase
MKTIWKKAKKSILDGYHSVSDKAEELTKIGRLKLEIVAVKRDIEKAFIELGGRIYDAFQENKEKGILADQDVNKIIEIIRDKDSKLKDLNQKVQNIREQSNVQIEE